MENIPAGTPIIIDVGSAYTKVGFAGDKSPRYVFPSITGTEKYKAVMADVSTRSIYVGNDAMKMRGVLKVSHPIQRGNIMDWNAYYEILNYIFYSLLRIDNLAFYPVLYVEQPFIQRETKEYIARVLYETHKVESLMMVPSPLLSIFSAGLTNGLVIESGDGTTWIVPIINGQVYHQAVQRLNLAGMDVNQNMKALMMREGINLSSSAADEIVREIKEQNCYFNLDPNVKPSRLDEKFQFPMPDGTFMAMPTNLLYEAPEVMFNPSMLGYNIMNVPQAVIYCLQMISNEYWADLLNHIVISGGNMSYSGFDARLKSELGLLVPQLGPIPKSASAQEVKKVTKLQAVDIAIKSEDTCPQCGALVNLADGKEHCPTCGASMKVTQISLGNLLDKGKEKKTKPGRCPYCGKNMKDVESSFCPYCGKNVDALDVPDTLEVELALSKATAYGGAEEFTKSFDTTDDLLKLFVPENLHFAIFSGASVLASLPSFRAYFVTYSQFNADPNYLYRDISQILGQSI
jgi:centractin